MPLGDFPDLSQYIQAATRTNAELAKITPLDNIIRGYTQGATLRGLPEQIRQEQLAAQLATQLQQANIRKLSPEAQQEEFNRELQLVKARADAAGEYSGRFTSVPTSQGIMIQNIRTGQLHYPDMTPYVGNVAPSAPTLQPARIQTFEALGADGRVHTYNAVTREDLGPKADIRGTVIDTNEGIQVVDPRLPVPTPGQTAPTTQTGPSATPVTGKEGQPLMPFSTKNIKAGDYTSQQLTSLNQLRDDYQRNKYVKIAQAAQGAIDVIIQGASQNNTAGDIAAINQFQSGMVDPGVSVRQEDVKLIINAAPVLARAKNYLPRLLQGGVLPPELRDEIKTTAINIYNMRARNANEIPGKQFKNNAKRAGIEFEDFGQEFDRINADGSKGQDQGPQSGTAPSGATFRIKKK